MFPTCCGCEERNAAYSTTEGGGGRQQKHSHGLLFQFPGAPEDMVLWRQSVKKAHSVLSPQDSTVF